MAGDDRGGETERAAKGVGEKRKMGRERRKRASTEKEAAPVE